MLNVIVWYFHWHHYFFNISLFRCLPPNNVAVCFAVDRITFSNTDKLTKFVSFRMFAFMSSIYRISFCYTLLLRWFQSFFYTLLLRWFQSFFYTLLLLDDSSTPYSWDDSIEKSQVKWGLMFWRAIQHPQTLRLISLEIRCEVTP